MIYHYSFSGDAAAVSSILKTMCLDKELTGWRTVNPTLDTNLCKEPLPLNKSGETPLDVARKAGHHEEIRQVYESLGLPTTIQEQLWLARCTAAKKKIAEERKANELTRQCSSLNSYYNGFMDSSDDEDDSNEDVSNCIILAVQRHRNLRPSEKFLVFFGDLSALMDSSKKDSDGSDDDVSF